MSRGRRSNPHYYARTGPRGPRATTLAPAAGPASCNAVRLIHIPFGHPRYPAGALYATQPVEIRVDCEVKGPHTEHVGVGGWRW